MKLFHFTTLYGAHGIAHSGRVRMGKVRSKGHVKNLAVSLTANPSSQHLGIPDGRPLAPDLAAALGEFAVCVDPKTGKKYCLDHTEFRLEFEIPLNESNLVRVSDFYVDEPETLDLLAMTAMHPFFLMLKPAQRILLKDRFRRSRSETDRTDQWWYFLDVLPLDYLVSVAHKIKDGKYSEPMSKIEYLQAHDKVLSDYKTVG